MTDYEKYLELVIKKLADSLSPGEEELLRKLREDNPKFSEQDHSIETAWKHAKNIEPEIVEIDIEQEWQEQRKRAKIKAKTFDLAQWNKYFAAAAVIIIFLAVVTLVWPKSETLYAQNQTTEYSLQDGSIVTLRKGSKLTIAGNFGKNIRKVELQGDAYFQVAHDTLRPFIVKTPDFDVVVKGTEFSVSSKHKEVFVKSGKVLVKNKDKQILLTDQQAAKIQNGELKQVKIEDQNYLAWKTGIIRFDNQNLDQVVKTLSKVYGVEIKLQDKTLKNLKITVTFAEQDLSTVLNVIAQTLDLKAVKNGNVYILKR